MGNTYVKNGTPVGNEHLCGTCSWGQIITGYRESEVLALCTSIHPTLRLPFRVHKCTEYEDKSRPDWKQMEKLAIEIEPLRVSKKTRGFSLPDPNQPEKPDHEPALPKIDEEEEEAELVAAIAKATTTRSC